MKTKEQLSQLSDSYDLVMKDLKENNIKTDIMFNMRSFEIHIEATKSALKSINYNLDKTTNKEQIMNINENSIECLLVVLENSKMMKNRKYVDPKEELTRHFDGLDLYMFISGLPVAGITKNQADKYFEQFGLDDNLLSSKLNKRYKQVLQFANETKQC